jgi:hypothetical protein
LFLSAQHKFWKETETMKNTTACKLQLLALSGALLLTSPAVLAQRTRQQTPQPQQVQNAAQPKEAAPAAMAPASLCANRPLCYEANDFVATVTEFRVSTDPRGLKIIDAMMHFQNKTNQPISLGYVDGSGSAIDDMGNRLGLNTYNGGVRGMGVVAGNNMDPKFTLGAGGGGDARFELFWAPGNRLSGVNYELEVSIREMNRVEGNQWTLGDEALLHYQGLANGTGVAPVSNVNSAGMGMASGSGGGSAVVNNAVTSFVPGQNSAGNTQTIGAAQPCPPGGSTRGTLINTANSAGAQNQPANDTVSNATTAISNLGSLFGHKKKAPNATTTANAAAPCTPVANAAVVPAAAPAAVPATTATTATTAVPQANAKVATAAARPVAGKPVAGVSNTSLRQPAPASTPKPSPQVKKAAATKPAANPNAPAPQTK